MDRFMPYSEYRRRHPDADQGCAPGCPSVVAKHALLHELLAVRVENAILAPAVNEGAKLLPEAVR